MVKTIFHTPNMQAGDKKVPTIAILQLFMTSCNHVDRDKRVNPHTYLILQHQNLVWDTITEIWLVHPLTESITPPKSSLCKTSTVKLNIRTISLLNCQLVFFSHMSLNCEGNITTLNDEIYLYLKKNWIIWSSEYLPISISAVVYLDQFESCVKTNIYIIICRHARVAERGLVSLLPKKSGRIIRLC